MATNGASASANTSIPIVDFGKFLKGTEEEKQRIASEIDQAFQGAGFVYLKNHGVPKEKVEECFQWSKKFFDLPYETKMLAPHPPGASHHRGYSGLGLEKASQNVFDKDELAKIREVPDHKESYESGNVNDPAQPNIWLPEDKLPGFRDFMESYFILCADLVHRILHALSIALNVPEPGLSPTHAKSLFQLRILHYPSLPKSQLINNARSRINAHSDFGSLTLLFQDSVGGLEVEDPSNPGAFRPATPIENTVLVNIGDLMMRWSNDRWRSTIHRVGIPTRIDEKTEMVNGEEMCPPRYSIPFFSVPDMDAVIDTLPGCIDEQHPKKYEPVTAWGYVQMRMAAIYDS